MLYLASSSLGRKQLLNEAEIPFSSIMHTSDEIVPSSLGNLSVESYTEYVARMKIQNIVIPQITPAESTIVVLVADTMVENADGKILGKPSSIEDARLMLKSLHNTWCKVVTSFIIQRLKVRDNEWKIDAEHQETATSSVLCSLHDHQIEQYLAHEGNRVLSISSSLDLTGFGAQFIKEIKGSYTSIIGLPIAEVVEALEKLGYKR